MLTTLEIVLPVFIVIWCGYFLRRIGFVTAPTVSAMTRMVFYVFAPPLLFRGAARAPVGESVDLAALGLIVGVTFAFAGVIYVLAGRSAPARRGVLAQGAHRSNMVFMGLPIVTYTYGESVLGMTAVLIGVMVVVYNFLGVLLLVLPHRKISSRQPEVWREAAVKIARNPLIIASGGGILFAALGLGVPTAIDRSLDLMGRVALPLALVAVGAGLDFRRLRSEIGPAMIMSVLKLVLYPAAMWAGLRMLGIEGTALAVPVLVLAAPTAVVSYIMACQMDGDEQLAGAIVIGSTVVSLVSYVGWLAFLGV